MAISQKDQKLLWGRAAARCSICKIELAEDKRATNGTYVVGEQAHIVAEVTDGPRGVSILSLEERNSYHNLILLCPTHHTVIDSNVDDYPVERLFLIKSQHELWVRRTLESGADIQSEAEAVTQESLMSFVREWRKFYSFYQIFHTKIQGWLIRTDKKGGGTLDELLPDIQEWRRRINKLRELLFRVGEEKLIVQPIPDWTDLAATDEFIKRRGYRTPFSYLLDMKNPIGFVNHNMDASWGSIFISYEYLEYLSYRYEEIKQIMEEPASSGYYESEESYNEHTSPEVMTE